MLCYYLIYNKYDALYVSSFGVFAVDDHTHSFISSNDDLYVKLATLQIVQPTVNQANCFVY